MSIEEVLLLDLMNVFVAKNIKRLREENKLSMDELAKLSGVSKSMLAQIERGDGNPTKSTLWKISNGMKVPFDALTVRPKNPYEIVRTAELQPLLEDGGKVKNYSLFPDDENRRFAVYYLELDKDSYWESEPHLKGTVEFITIFAGKI
jgi:transcriptional regulator with XRE-family HTH domain